MEKTGSQLRIGYPSVSPTLPIQRSDALSPPVSVLESCGVALMRGKGGCPEVQILHQIVKDFLGLIFGARSGVFWGEMWGATGDCAKPINVFCPHPKLSEPFRR